MIPRRRLYYSEGATYLSTNVTTGSAAQRRSDLFPTLKSPKTLAFECVFTVRLTHYLSMGLVRTTFRPLETLLHKHSQMAWFG